MMDFDNGESENLTEHDLPGLLIILNDARARWESIATQLGQSQGDIESIAKTYHHDPKDCLRESIKVWLRSVEPVPTRKQLAKALTSPPVDRYDLAKSICASIEPPINQNASVLKSICCAVMLPIVFACVLYHYYQSGSFPQTSLSLPDIQNILIGRENETNTIMGYLTDPQYHLVTLYGQAGFGKSEIAVHVGHQMLEMEYNVHYIKVEDYADVEALERVLMDITESEFTNMKLVRWSKSLRKKTLLILDNVDRDHWVKKESRQEIRNKFIEVLLSHSSLLKVLVTSQEDLRTKNSQHSKSSQLYSLNTENCVILVNTLVSQDPNISQSEALCSLVGNVPMAIKVLTAIMLHPEYSMDYLIARLNQTISSKKLEFLATTGDRVDKDRLLSAIKLAFEFIEPQYQICSLLLVKFPGSFKLHAVESIITPEMMEYVTFSDFKVSDCLYELRTKSFLEQTSFMSVLKQKTLPGRYHFHVLIRDFLNTSTAQDKHNVSGLLNAFWKNYLDWLSNDSGDLWFFDDLSREDLDAFAQILHKEDSYSYSLAVALCSNRLFVRGVVVGNIDLLQFPVSSNDYNEGRLHYKSVLKTAAGILVSDCGKPGLYYPVSGVSRVINAYIISFEEIICTDDNHRGCMDTLISCQPKVEQLHLAAKGDHKAMEASSYFHNALVELKCLETKSTHGVCDLVWKYRLLGVVHMLVSVRDVCLEHCKSSQNSKEVIGKECEETLNTNTIMGLEYYALMEDDKAIRYLHLALKEESSSGCKELHDTLLYMALYVMYSRQGNHQGVEDSISGIVNIDFSNINMTCYTAIFGDTVIPFLRQVNETGLVKKLRDLRIDALLEAVSNCQDHPLNCQNENRYKTPILNTLLSLQAFWVEDMVSSGESLLCSITKEVMSGCDCPFPLMTKIFRAQFAMGEGMTQLLAEIGVDTRLNVE